MQKKINIFRQVKAVVPMFAARVLVHVAAAFVLMASVFVSCADEAPSNLYADDEADMDFGVTVDWQAGRVLAGTRSADEPSINDYETLIGQTFPFTAYPSSIWMEVGSSSYAFTADDFEATPTEKAHPRNFVISQGDYKKPAITDDVPTGWLDYHNQFLIKNYGDEAKASPKPFYKKSEMKGFVINAFWPWKREVDATANVDFPKTPTPFATDTDGKLTTPRHWTNADVSSFSSNDFLYDHIEDAETEDRIEGHHLKLALKHAMAMLRLYFSDSKDYEKVRHIVLREVKIVKVGDKDVDYTFNVNACSAIDRTSGDESMPGFLLTTSPRFYAYGYMKPVLDDNVPEQQTLTTLSSTTVEGWNASAISVITPITMQCTYDIYDKDILAGVDLSDANAVATALAGNISAHCTRRSVTATNTFMLGRLLAGTSGGTQSTTISKLQPGYYYDLKITINPEYLYVLSLHDNKQHITIE